MPTVSRWLGDRPQFFDANGDPLASGRLFFYEADSSTKANTYTTSAGSVANSNPITLDSAGRPATMIHLDVSKAYDIKLANAGSDDPPSSVIWTEEDVVPADPTGITTVVDNAFVVTGSADATKKLAFEVDGITAGTTRTLTVQDKSGTVPLTAEFDYSNLAGSPGRLPLPKSYINGLTFAPNGSDATNDIDIAAGSCRDASNAHNLILSATLTKRLDASWAVGTNQGGLDGTESVAGTPDTSTWYYIWLIKRSDTGVVDALFSESSSSPTMPSSYDYKRLIGAVYNNSSGDIEQFTAFETGDGGLQVMWTTPPLDINLANTLTTSRRTDVITVPALSVIALIRAHVWDATTAGSAVICGTQETDAAPSFSASPLSTINWITGMRGTRELAIALPAANATLAARSTLATTDEYQAVTLGWIWSRR